MSALPTPALFKPASLKPKASPVVPTLESLPINPLQCEKALKALLAHVAKTQAQADDSDLLGDAEEKLMLVVGLKRGAKREVHKPYRLPLAHPLIDPRTSPVTLFVKDPQREYKDLMESSKITFINRVVGLEKLRAKHKTFEAKRALLKDGDLFLVDDRVVVEVGKSIGKMWRDAKKQPIPVALSRKDLKAELERAVASTYLQLNTGTSLTIKFGSTALHTEAQLVENLISLLPQLVILPHSGWSNIQSLHIKTRTSAALPIFSCSLEALSAVKSQDELEAIEAKHQEKLIKEGEREQKALDKEKRRLERSATKEGKGREGKADSKVQKRKAEESVAVEEVEAEVVSKKAKSESIPAARVKKVKAAK